MRSWKERTVMVSATVCSRSMYIPIPLTDLPLQPRTRICLCHVVYCRGVARQGQSQLHSGSSSQAEFKVCPSCMLLCDACSCECKLCTFGNFFLLVLNGTHKDLRRTRISGVGYRCCCHHILNHSLTHSLQLSVFSFTHTHTVQANTELLLAVSLRSPPSPSEA